MSGAVAPDVAIRCVARLNKETLAPWRRLSYNAILPCGHRQVVRPQLPKLVFAGSNPVARSIDCCNGQVGPRSYLPVCIPVGTLAIVQAS